jgi:hypothetical protein
LVQSLVAVIRGHGGFRETSPNYVGQQSIENAIAAFAEEGYELAHDGQLRRKLLDNLAGATLTQALGAYVRRAKRGADDAALVTGTGKDLLEAIAAHIHLERYGIKSRDLDIAMSGDVAFADMLHLDKGNVHLSKAGREPEMWVRSTVCCQRTTSMIVADRPET